MSRLFGEKPLLPEDDLADDENGAESATSIPPGLLQGQRPTGEGVRGDVGGSEPRDRHMRSLLETDKEMELIRIGIEIERILARLERDNDIAPERPESHGAVRSRVWNS